MNARMATHRAGCSGWIRGMAAILALATLFASVGFAQDEEKGKAKTKPKPTKAATTKTKGKPPTDAADGKKYDVLTIPTGTSSKVALNDALVALREETFGAEQAAAVETFVRDHLGAVMTQNPADCATIRVGTVRQRLVGAAARNPAALTALNQYLLAAMPKLVAGNHHPSVKVNAMIIIADLNQAEETRKAGKVTKAATPYGPALATLAAAAGNAKLDPAVRAAALSGIARHAEAGIAAANQAAVRTALVAMLKEAPTDPVAAEGLAWNKSRAAGILGTMKGAGGNNEVAKELANIVTDAKSPVAVRVTAASSLGQMPLDAAGLDGAQVAGGLGVTVLDAYTQESQRAAGTGDELSSAKLGAQVTAVKQAFAGDGKAPGLTKSIKDAAAQGIVTDIAAKVDGVADALADPTTLPAKIEDLRKSLQTHKLIAGAPAAAADATAVETTKPAPVSTKAGDAKPGDAKSAATGAKKQP